MLLSLTALPDLRDREEHAFWGGQTESESQFCYLLAYNRGQVFNPLCITFPISRMEMVSFLLHWAARRITLDNAFKAHSPDLGTV